MKIYTYDQHSGEFISSDEADKSPLEDGVYLVPAWATTIEPPEYGSRETCIFENGNWTVKPDWRGVELFKSSDGTPTTIKEIGVTPIDIEATEINPPPGWLFKIFDGITWVFDIETAKNYICDTVIQQEKSRVKNGGFYVNDILFDSDDTAQIALTQFSLKLNSDPSYVVTNWKASTGVWVTMDAVLFSQVMSAWENHCKACFDWQEAKEEEISACAIATEIQAVSLVFGE